jgi:SpoVK/Ycf46/Vps4 family AAA+-type ATPase
MAATDPENPMNDSRNPLSELEAQLLRDPFNAAARLDYARALLAATRPEDALTQYDLARKQGATPALEEFEALRASPPPAPPPAREPVKLSVVPGARSAEVVSIARPVAVAEKTRFVHIAGMDDLKKSIRLQIIEPFINPGLFAKFRKKAGGGILLYGPPGCGKTMLARAVANECNASFLAIGISEILTAWLGESERNLALMFEKARSQKPCVMFFDELDALAFARSKASSDTSRKIVNEFLSQLDGFEKGNDQVLILAATNMPWDVDPAMKRPGRFARQVFVPPPDAVARARIIELALESVPHGPVDTTALANATEQFSGADVDALVERAKEYVLSEYLETRREREISQDDLTRATAELIPSTQDWLRTARNLVKYAGGDDTYRDLERYLKANKLL